MSLHAIINRGLRLFSLPSSGIVDSGHFTAIAGIPMEVAHQVRGSGARQDVATMDNSQAYADTGMLHDWLSVHPFAEASEAHNSAL